MKLAVQYFLIFTKQKKIFYFFGQQLVIYTAALALLFAIVLFLQINTKIFNAFMVVLVGIVFVAINSAALASFINMRLSDEHNEYLFYLGFTKQQIRALSRMITLPAVLIEAVFLYLSYSEVLPWGFSLLTTLLLVFIGDRLCYFSIMLRSRLKEKNKVNARKKRVNKKLLLRSYKNPYSAFFHKDLHLLRTTDMVTGGSAAIFVALCALVFSIFIPYSLPVFTGILYIYLFPMIGVLIFGLYKGENDAYNYYHASLRLEDSQILVYKLSLQLFCTGLAIIVFSISMGVAHGFHAEFLLILLGTLVYVILYCLSLSIWYLRRLHKGHRIQLLFEYASLVISIIPCLALLYLLVLLLHRAINTLFHYQRNRIA